MRDNSVTEPVGEVVIDIQKSRLQAPSKGPNQIPMFHIR